MSSFNSYAEVYDALYTDKPYPDECAIIDTIAARYEQRPATTLLDLGCGTGSHALVWARAGMRVCGVDNAPTMLALATDKTRRNGLDIEYVNADIRTLDLGRHFDRAVGMFAVMSYLVTPADFEAGLNAVRRHLDTGGLFVFDAWYGPGMDNPPRDRITRIRDGNREIIKLAVSHKLPEQQVAVDFTVLVIEEDRLVQRIEECHRLRYFFEDELTMSADRAGFEILEITACDSPDTPPANNAWTARITCRALD